jgi:2-C-methyl-D-erythritol 4-phosphate cytidylyltransferase
MGGLFMNQNRIVVAVVVAAGKSRRMGGGKNKVLNLLAGRPVISYCLSVFQRSAQVQHVVVVGREDDRSEFEEIVGEYCPKAEGHFTPGGAERFDSVKNGLEYWRDMSPEAVLIHDAARPFLQERFIEDSLAVLSDVPGCVVGVPLKDTLKEVGEGERVVRTHERGRYWLAQTPQTFRYEEILQAYRACNPPPYPTDDGAVLELLGRPVKMVPASYLNIKLTNPEDWTLAEAILQAGTW